MPFYLVYSEERKKDENNCICHHWPSIQSNQLCKVKHEIYHHPVDNSTTKYFPLLFSRTTEDSGDINTLQKKSIPWMSCRSWLYLLQTALWNQTAARFGISSDAELIFISCSCIQWEQGEEGTECSLILIQLP